MATDKRAKNVKDRFDTLKNGRTMWEQVWQETLEYSMPRKAFITRRREIQGERIREDIYDSTARRANQILAAGLQGNLTNPSSRWFKLRLQQLGFNNIPEVKFWLGDAEDKIFDILNSSNFHQQIHEYYLDLGAVGTAVMIEMEDPVDVIRFSTRPIDEVVVAENGREAVDTIYRKYTLTARQAFERFGAKAGKETLDAIEKDKWDHKVKFIHCVRPRDVRNPYSSTTGNMEFESLHVSDDSLEIVDESGFNEFPYMVTRFMKVAGDMYGYSPGVIMLPDIKMLNAITKTVIKGAQKIVDPPLIMPHDGFLLPLRTVPGGINYRLSGSPQDRIEPLETRANIPVGREMQNDLRESINRGFFVDLFLTLADRRNMTATEVSERVQEKMLLLGPALGRLQSELLDPIITRTFNILLRKGVFLPPPEVLQGQDIVVEYVSPLALAQKGEQVQSTGQFLTMVSGLAQVKPDALDLINEDGVVLETANIFGVKPTMINDPETVAAIREQRAQQAQAAQQMAMAREVSEIAKNASDAGMEEAAAGAAEGAI
jgi:hypothetical protein